VVREASKWMKSVAPTLQIGWCCGETNTSVKLYLLPHQTSKASKLEFEALDYPHLEACLERQPLGQPDPGYQSRTKDKVRND
jgi:hypothetical protein